MALGFERDGEVEEEIMTARVCIYKVKGCAVQLRRCPWWFTSDGHVACMQLIESCSMFPRAPGLSGGRCGFSGIQAKEI